ncbi:MAG: hypothetical protein NTX97_04330 [Bacteroidetes bacterium]|nr:hypothetical protein [Bacteroidota bacterium]
MKNILQNTLKVIVIIATMSLFSGCYMFHKKNRCGDCPKWKVELSESLSNNFF